MKSKSKKIGLIIYFVFLFLPIYWMINMSLRTNADILGSFALYPTDPTFKNYIKIFTDSSWYSGYINSIIYVTINTVISLTVALPAAYAFSRYQFVGDKQFFFWLLTNRMAPSAVFLVTVFSTLFNHRSPRYPYCRGPGPLSVQRALGRMDTGRLHVRHSPRN